MKCEPRDANWKKIPATSGEKAGFRKSVRATCLGNWADGASAGPVTVRLGQLTKGLDLRGAGSEEAIRRDCAVSRAERENDGASASLLGWRRESVFPGAGRQANSPLRAGENGWLQPVSPPFRCQQ
jgi:hypothetical protein